MQSDRHADRSARDARDLRHGRLLLDTERFYTEVTQRIVGRLRKVFDWSVKSNMVGRPAIESARYLVATLELPITAEDYLRERGGMLEELMPTAEPMPGAVELTATPLAARGVPQRSRPAPDAACSI